MANRRVVSAIPLSFTRLIKNEFVWGIVFGAVFSLIVNIITVQIQEVIAAQRVQEAIENEIFTNKITADGVIKLNTELVEQQAKPNFFLGSRRYTNTVWENSEILKYTMQFKPTLQSELNVFYTSVLPFQNQFLDRNSQLSEARLAECYFTSGQTNVEYNNCMGWYRVFLNGEIMAAQAVSKSAEELLTNFHPTKNRLESRFLRLLMGKEALKGLTSDF